MQGLAVIPLFAGYDEASGDGRIFSYDVAGGPYEEHRFHSIGSGSIFAKSSLKKLYRDDMPTSDAVLASVQALYDAADDDSATGGPDLTRRIYPVIATITATATRGSLTPRPPTTPSRSWTSRDALARRPVRPAAGGRLARPVTSIRS